MHTKILNKNKIQDGGDHHFLIFAQAAITQPPIDVNELNFAEMYTDVTENRPFDLNGQK